MRRKKNAPGWRPKSPEPVQIHVLSKDPQWIGQLNFICQILKCSPESFFHDLVPVHYSNLVQMIDREARKEDTDEQPAPVSDGVESPS